MNSDEGAFWDRRYVAEGDVWGEQPSPTAVLTTAHLAPGARVLDIGSGYGRDLAFLRQRGCQVSGVDMSTEGHRLARERLLRQGGQAERLFLGRFEDLPVPAEAFDAVLSHRMAHLLILPEAIAVFAARLARVLRPGGILAVGARNPADLDPAEMVCVREQVYEYRRRPGHQVRYWDDATFRQAFGDGFTILALRQVAEPESRAHPVACHLTVMIARKNAESNRAFLATPA